jgi:FMN phosphatase YigB (HAD superfamily)
VTGKPAIKAVIFDVGGVLDQAADQAAELADRQQIAAELGLDLDEMWRVFFQTDPWYLARVGAISDAEFWNLNLAPLGIVDPLQQEAFLKRLFAHKGVTPAMRALLHDLCSRVKLGIISNASDTLEAGLERHFRVAHLFDVIINSARVSCAKPEPKIYELALSRLGVAPEEAVFTDDAALFTDAHDFRACLVELGVLEAQLTPTRSSPGVCS